MKPPNLFLPVLFANALARAFPAPSPENSIPTTNNDGIIPVQALLCPTVNSTENPLGHSNADPYAYTFYLNRVPGLGDPHVLTPVIDDWIRRLATHSVREAIPDNGLVLDDGSAAYELHVAQAGDRRLEYYHASRSSQMLWEHYNELMIANKDRDSVPLMEVRMAADGVLEGTVRLVTSGRGGCDGAGVVVGGGGSPVATS